MNTRQEVFDAARAACAELGLAVIYDTVMSTNPGAYNPYHNNYHLACVALNCVAGAASIGVSPEQTRELVAAALVHDLGHSGGSHADDALNIRDALRLAKRILVPHNLLNSNVEQLIKCTQYPFKIIPTTTCMQILRDADLMQSGMPDAESMIAIGLKVEVEKIRGVQFTDQEWAQGQLDFVNNLTIYSTWGRVQWARMYPEVDDPLYPTSARAFWEQRANV